uniref:Uncharacterized protein n=1 Tax=viral metagenome TaxID=1070528 RepID=A0A6H1ZRI7_9ZZZZ
MCLDTIDKETKNWRIGYKIFRRGRRKSNKDKVYSPLYKTRNGMEMGKWIKDSSEDKLKVTKSQSYDSGFHFYKYKEEAIEDCQGFCYNGDVVHKVKVRGLIATGTQNKCEVGVTKEMFILERISE